VILSLDWPLIKDNPSFGRISGKPPYDGACSRPVPEYSAEAVRMSAHLLHGSVLVAPDWLDPSQDRPDTVIGFQPISASSYELADLAAQVERNTAVGDERASALLRCHAQPAGGFGGRAPVAARRRPPSISSFRPIRWRCTPTGRRAAGAQARSCRSSGSEVFADICPCGGARRRHRRHTQPPRPRLRHGVGDHVQSVPVSRHEHVLDPGTYQSILLRIARGDSVLTWATWPTFESTLRDEVGTYRLSAAPL